MFSKKKKLMVIGVDGVSIDLLKAYASQGIMPAVNNLIKRYGIKRTRSPLPEISSVSWTSFFTGKNPGDHGIYGFMDIHRENYSYQFPSFDKLPVKALWESIGERGLKSIVLNMPSTYPAKKLNGILVSGFVALDLKEAVYPRSYHAQLEKMNYRVDVDTALAQRDPVFFMRELNEILDLRFTLGQSLLKKKWHLFVFVVTGTDRINHFYYQDKDIETAPAHEHFIDYYRNLDNVIGEITQDMEKKGIPFIILSDHGFVPLQKEVYLSSFLKEWGWLKFKEAKPKSIKDMDPASKVFALDPSRLYVNLKSRYKPGTVEEREYHSLLIQIKEKFSTLELGGKKVIKEIYLKEELYSGAFLQNAPDVVLKPEEGFDLKAGITKQETVGLTHFQGMHYQDNALLIDSGGLVLETFPYIYTIGQNILHYFTKTH